MMRLDENLFEALNEEIVIKPTDNSYHDVWYLDDRYAVHNDGGKFHVIDRANGNNYLLNSDSIDEVNEYIKNTLNLDMSIEPSNRQFKKKANIDINKDKYLRDAAEMDWESGHTFDPDDFSYFKRVCKEDGYNVNEEDFQKYWEYFDECRAKQFADEDNDTSVDLGDWEEMESKQVEDSDGFMTDYTWYVKDNADGSETHVMIFGDQDIYTPMNSEPDAEFDGEDIAREWFNAYNGFAEDDELEESIDSDEADLNESIDSDVKDYTIEYYDNTSAAERRPTTIDDIERNYSIEVVAFPNDFSACVYALAIHDEADYEFNQEEYLEEFGYADELKTTADVLTKLDDIDWGDGSIIICKITQGDRVVYDSGLSKESLLKDTEDESLEESVKLPSALQNRGLIPIEFDTKRYGFDLGKKYKFEDSKILKKAVGTVIEPLEVVCPADKKNSVENYFVTYNWIRDNQSDFSAMDLDSFLRLFKDSTYKEEENLSEAVKPNIESEELKALAQKHNIKILDAMSNGDLRMEGAGADLMKFYQEAEQLGLWQVNPELYEALHGKEEIDEFFTLAKKLGFHTMYQMNHIMKAAHDLGYSELDFLKSVDKTFNGKIPDSLIDGITDEFLVIAEEIGLETQEDYERFCKEEVEPGETITQAIKRYRDEINDLELDESVLFESNVDKDKVLDYISNAKAYIEENKFAQAKDSLTSAANLLDAPINEGAMSNLDLEIKEAGGQESWKDLASKELAEMKDSLHYLRTYAPKEIGAGGNYDSARELQDDIDALEKDIDELQTKIDYINSIKRIG